MKLRKESVLLLMAKKGLNQSVLAIKAGISRQTLSAVMNGRSCRPELLGKIAKALEVDVEEIVKTEK